MNTNKNCLNNKQNILPLVIPADEVLSTSTTILRDFFFSSPPTPHILLQIRSLGCTNLENYDINLTSCSRLFMTNVVYYCKIDISRLYAFKNNLETKVIADYNGHLVTSRKACSNGHKLFIQ